MKGFSASLDMRRCKIIKSVPKNIQLSKDLSHQIPWSRVPHSTLNSLRDCWRSIAIAAWGSISLEADGKCLCVQSLAMLLVSTNLQLTVLSAHTDHSSTLAWKIPWTEEPGGL